MGKVIMSLLVLTFVGLSQAGMILAPTKKACATDADCGADQCCLTVSEDSPASSIGKRDGTTMVSHKECRSFQQEGGRCCPSAHMVGYELCGCKTGFVCRYDEPEFPVPMPQNFMFYCTKNITGLGIDKWAHLCPELNKGHHEI